MKSFVTVPELLDGNLQVSFEAGQDSSGQIKPKKVGMGKENPRSPGGDDRGEKTR